MSEFLAQFMPDPSKPSLDRESFTRELLRNSLTDWLTNDVIYIQNLNEMRAAARKLLGQEEERFVAKPQEIAQLHCIEFRRFSPLNRRQAIADVFAFIGLTERTAMLLLGEEGWAMVQNHVEAICTDKSFEVTDTRNKLGIVDDWTRNALATRLKQLTSKKHFDICALDSACYALSALRKALALPDGDAEKIPEYAGLRVLHCVDYDKMPPEVLSGLPAAVIRVLGLHDQGGAQLFGDDMWNSIRCEIESVRISPIMLLDMTEVEIMPKETEPVKTEQEHRVRTPFKWLRFLLKPEAIKKDIESC